MTASSYDRQSFAAALAQVGVRKGDVVFSHSNIGFFGMPRDAKSAPEACEVLRAAIFDVLGPEGTLIVPTFTYSFCKGQPFDPDQTPSTCGLFTEWLRKHPGARRSHDPIFSVAAVGARAEELTADAPRHCFGPGSFWERFLRAGGLLCNWNFDAGSTFLHYVERCLGVPYRYDKVFCGEFVQNGVTTPGAAVFHCQDMSNPDTVAAFEPFDALARERGIVRTVKVGRGAVVALRAAEAYALVAERLRTDPWLLTEAGKAGRGASVSLSPPPAQPLDLPLDRAWETLSNTPRDLVSPGLDVTLATLARHFPLAIHAIPTGTSLGNRIVPERWECLEASLHASADDPPLPITLAPVRYSPSFEGTVTRAELLAHVHSDPHRAAVIPERFGYYDRVWGLCMPQRERDQLIRNTYHVRLKTRLGFGSMRIGEWVIPGESEESLLLVSGISGTGPLDACKAMLEVAERLAASSRSPWTYRFLLASAEYGVPAFRHLYPNVAIRSAVRFEHYDVRLEDRYGSTDSPIK